MSETCTVSAHFTDLALQPAAGVRVVFQTAADYRGSVVERSVEVVSDEEGDIEVELPRGVRMWVSVLGRGHSSVIEIPDQEEANLLDLVGLAPNPYEVTP